MNRPEIGKFAQGAVFGLALAVALLSLVLCLLNAARGRELQMWGWLFSFLVSAVNVWHFASRLND